MVNRKLRHGGRLGVRRAAIALKAARLRAGFASAADAAKALGVSENTLRAHESGHRRISEKQASLYANALLIDRDVLLREADHLGDRDLLREIEDLSYDAGQKSRVLRKEQALRLRFARLLRGHDTLSSAARLLGISRGTAGTHENGQWLLSDEIAKAYADAYGIESRWLLNGEGPSGLGPKVDAGIRMVNPNDMPDTASRFDAVPLVRDRSEWTAVQEIFAAALSNRSPIKIPEVDAQSSRNMLTANLKQQWVIPPASAEMLAAEAKLVAVPLGVPLPPWKVGDRLFVDRSRRDPCEGGTFVYIDREGDIALRTHDEGEDEAALQDKPFGKLVGIFHFD
jgi:DNA-binding XRE family transcriptional regulator